jgi:hypothetical protein
MHNYNLYDTFHPSIYASETPSFPEILAGAEAPPVTQQSYGDTSIPPREYNPFVTEPKMVLIENNNCRDQCGLQRLEPENSF